MSKNSIDNVKVALFDVLTEQVLTLIHLHNQYRENADAVAAEYEEQFEKLEKTLHSVNDLVNNVEEFGNPSDSQMNIENNLVEPQENTEVDTDEMQQIEPEENTEAPADEIKQNVPEQNNEVATDAAPSMNISADDLLASLNQVTMNQPVNNSIGLDPNASLFDDPVGTAPETPTEQPAEAPQEETKEEEFTPLIPIEGEAAPVENPQTEEPPVADTTAEEPAQPVENASEETPTPAEPTTENAEASVPNEEDIKKQVMADINVDVESPETEATTEGTPSPLISDLANKTEASAEPTPAPETNTATASTAPTIDFTKTSNDPAKAILVNQSQFTKLEASKDTQKAQVSLGNANINAAGTTENDIEALLRKASDLYKEGKTAEAEAIYEQVRSLNKAN